MKIGPMQGRKSSVGGCQTLCGPRFGKFEATRPMPTILGSAKSVAVNRKDAKMTTNEILLINGEKSSQVVDVLARLLSVLQHRLKLCYRSLKC